MTPAVLLLIFRLLGAFLLLAFLGLLMWYLAQDLKALSRTTDNRRQNLGALRVIQAGDLPQPVAAGYSLSPVTTIGRSNKNTVVLDQPYVSNEHALLVWRDARWWLEDLGSRNGTLLNDAPLTEAVVISAGDVITIGSIQLKLELPQEEST